MCYKLTTCLPRHVTNSRCRADVGSTVGQRRRRWFTIVPTLGQRLAFIHFTTGQASFSLVSLHPIIAHSVNTIEHNARELCLPLSGYFCPLTSPGLAVMAALYWHWSPAVTRVHSPSVKPWPAAPGVTNYNLLSPNTGNWCRNLFLVHFLKIRPQGHVIISWYFNV